MPHPLTPRSSQFRLDLGLNDVLLPAWRALWTTQGLSADVISGITVACIAVPLSLAIAVASQVPPAIGLVTAVIAGIVCAFFGGTPLAVSGPAAAMAVLIARVVEQHGLGGLLAVGFGAGLLQLVTGVFRLGRLVRYVPVGVVEGFTAGIGAIILIGQLPRALGLPPPDQAHVLRVITHIRDEIRQTQGVSLGLSMLALFFCVVTPRFTRRIPGALLAVVVPTLVVAGFKLYPQTIGEIPRTLPLPHMPVFPRQGIDGIAVSIVMVYALASLETLLSSTAVDKLSGAERHDPDQELIGQGIGNMIVSLFGGIPITGVIARSALNVQSGAKTRRSSIVHSLVLLATVFLLAPVMSRIPMAALAGVLLSVALRMLDPGHLLRLWKASRSEAIVYVVTFAVIVLGDLILGVQAGLALALLIVAVRVGHVEAELSVLHNAEHAHLFLRGAVTFLSQAEIERVRERIDQLQGVKGVVLHARDVTELDVTGAELLTSLIASIEARGIRVAVFAMPPRARDQLVHADPTGALVDRFANTGSEVESILEPDHSARPIDRLVSGVKRFRETQGVRYAALFEQLAHEQTPHTLFITCSDSRINPNMVTSTEPGELFLVRNVGNLIPSHEDDGTPAEGAAIEYALEVLKVREIVVCGHSGCGAMRALMAPKTTAKLTTVTRWLTCAESLRAQLGENADPNVASRANVLLQLDHLRVHPLVREHIARGDVRIHGWYYDIRSSELWAWDASVRNWHRLDDESSKLTVSTEPGPRSLAPSAPAAQVADSPTV